VDPGEAVLLVGAGVIAGAVNTIAGAGSLLTFPALLGTGLSPLAANVTNCIGVVPGSISGAYGMRQHLRGLRAELVRLCAWAALGSAVGAVLLLTLPSSAFDAVVPVLVGLAGVLVLLQPAIVRWTGRVHGSPASPATGPAVGVVTIYSGYFGAAQGVLLIGAIGSLRPRTLKETNAVKNVIGVFANGVAGVIFAFAAPVHWLPVLCLAVGSASGGPIGAALAQRIKPGPLRVFIAVVSFVVAAKLARDAW
jgi:uncharacterized membrane protein YfcA